MDIEKIEKFIDAGYTKSEIDALLSEGKPDAIQGEDKNNPESTKPEGTENEGAKNAQNDVSVDTAEMLATLTKTVEGLTNTVKVLQSENIKNANIGSKTVDAIKETMDSFLKDL